MHLTCPPCTDTQTSVSAMKGLRTGENERGGLCGHYCSLLGHIPETEEHRGVPQPSNLRYVPTIRGHLYRVALPLHSVKHAAG